MKGHSAGACAVFHPGGNYLVSVSSDRTLRIWDMRNLVLTDEIEIPGAPLCLRKSELPRGFRIGSPAGVLRWDPSAGETVQTSAIPERPLTGMIVDRYGQVVSCDAAGTVYQHEVSSARRECSFVIAPGQSPIGLSNSGEFLVLGQSGKTPSLWSMRTQSKVCDIPITLVNVHYTSPVAAFSADDRLLAIPDADFSIHIYDVASMSLVKQLRGHESGVVDLSFSPCDPDVFASASWDNTARIWSIERGQVVHTLKHSLWLSAATFSPDGTRLATASGDGTLKVWIVKLGRQLISIDTGIEHPRQVEFSQDGTCIALAWFGHLRVYRADDEEPGNGDWDFKR